MADAPKAPEAPKTDPKVETPAAAVEPLTIDHGTHLEVWATEVPPPAASYRVTEDEWTTDEAGKQVRTVKAVELVEA